MGYPLPIQYQVIQRCKIDQRSSVRTVNGHDLVNKITTSLIDYFRSEKYVYHEKSSLEENNNKITNENHLFAVLVR